MQQFKTSKAMKWVPDTITINGDSIEVVTTRFFFLKDTTTIPLKTLASSRLRGGLFFSTLILESAGTGKLEIKHLKKKDAKRIQSLLLPQLNQAA